MKRLLVALGSLFLPSTALACSCSSPASDAERRDYARFIAAKTHAIVEAEPVSGPDINRQIGDTYRIVSVIAGDVRPGLIRMARTFGRDSRTGEAWMGGTSCDVFPGSRKRVLLMRTGYQLAGGGPIVPAFAMPASGCKQVLPIKDPPPDLLSRGYVPVFSFGMSCTDWFLGEPGAVDLIREEARKLGRLGF